ncbi:hypothetical protein BX661DRAFT_176508 [Kickxella alabastrina]|uniref:uncharacterized protein n=1 Tax=Kickxella alabastrina TaxID=61397 RepID=UPI00221E8F14|nr:uncharacterized protein BX661DRAFT_176480 [Kickxella alabastrina]XP_051394424.1 uncharacterized protein BX661DRAFT_176508 [Kickxella alabastrina]KAI7834015.1 hypothetical protein BX661DRAFT_176480 [Kickxella alabastrina]KAI7834036.1 hypothetical protein BX661DRAFT_176508 [Kickxella alabastrina]
MPVRPKAQSTTEPALTLSDTNTLELDIAKHVYSDYAYDIHNPKHKIAHSSRTVRIYGTFIAARADRRKAISTLLDKNDKGQPSQKQHSADILKRELARTTFEIIRQAHGLRQESKYAHRKWRDMYWQIHSQQAKNWYALQASALLVQMAPVLEQAMPMMLKVCPEAAVLSRLPSMAKRALDWTSGCHVELVQAKADTGIAMDFYGEVMDLSDQFLADEKKTAAFCEIDLKIDIVAKDRKTRSDKQASVNANGRRTNHPNHCNGVSDHIQPSKDIMQLQVIGHVFVSDMRELLGVTRNSIYNVAHSVVMNEHTAILKAIDALEDAMRQRDCNALLNHMGGTSYAFEPALDHVDSSIAGVRTQLNDLRVAFAKSVDTCSPEFTSSAWVSEFDMGAALASMALSEHVLSKGQATLGAEQRHNKARE